jgi:uncharacterized protein (TIGR02246 family)
MSAFEDRLAIHELIARYSHAIDGGDYEAWVDCFTPDAVFHSALGVSTGHEEIRAFARNYETSRARMPNARHYMTNIAAEVDGDEATCRSYVIITTSEPRGVRIHFTGQYDDRLVKLDGAWKFRERRGIPDTSIADTAAWRAAQKAAATPGA